MSLSVFLYVSLYVSLSVSLCFSQTISIVYIITAVVGVETWYMPLIMKIHYRDLFTVMITGEPSLDISTHARQQQQQSLIGSVLSNLILIGCFCFDCQVAP